jgi:transitional endoplasmic reticulum ATPase
MEEVMEVVSVSSDAEACASKIHDLCGYMVQPEMAGILWPRIEEHKWFLSEKLGRDVGIRVACLDLMENVESFGEELADGENTRLLHEMGAQMVEPEVWETIADSQPPKQIVEKRIILPLVERDLASKHGVTPPRTIIFFGPPGTGKTHFVRAIAGVLGWWYVEISPSTLMADGADRLGANLKAVMERARGLDEAVIFIDEFEEVAGSRDQASRLDKSITNEFLKQVPLLKAQEGRILLVCATNYIRQLDAALLRPGRFDCIIPVGALDDEGRRRIFMQQLSRTSHENVDVERITSMIPMLTPADIEFLFQKVTQTAFEREYSGGGEYRVTTETFLELIPKVRPTLTDEILTDFEEDSHNYTRF